MGHAELIPLDYFKFSTTDIEDDETRLIAIIDEVERLCKQSNEELSNFQAKVFPIVMHNYRELRSNRSKYFTNLN